MPNLERLEAAANIARGLAMDAIAACASGNVLMEEFGMTKAAIVAAANTL
jgi:hypothetical protein